MLTEYAYEDKVSSTYPLSNRKIFRSCLLTAGRLFQEHLFAFHVDHFDLMLLHKVSKEINLLQAWQWVIPFHYEYPCLIISCRHPHGLTDSVNSSVKSVLLKSVLLLGYQNQSYFYNPQTLRAT